MSESDDCHPAHEPGGYGLSTMTLTQRDPESEPKPRLAYLVAAYPEVSHTFITREIEALRARGLTVDTVAVRRVADEHLLSDSSRREAAQTRSLRPIGAGRFLRVHVRALLLDPAQYAKTLGLALRLSPGGARADLWHVFYFAQAILLWDLCRASDIRHVHVHFANVASAVALLAADFGRSDGLQWSFTMHGPTEFDDVTKFSLAEKVRRAAFVACISDYCRSQLLKLVDPELWDKLSVVHCGLAFGAGDDGPVATQIPPQAGMPLRVLTIGRLVPDKGQLMLLRALAQLRARNVAVALTIVGDGPDRVRLQRAAAQLGVADDVAFLGALGQDEISALFAASDVFCISSFAEGVPVVLMEAMAHGLPVVTTRIAGIAELVEDEVTGTLVAPGRPDLIAGALSRLAGEPALRLRWGRAGRERVREAYDVARSAELLEALLARSEAGTPVSPHR